LTAAHDEVTRVYRRAFELTVKLREEPANMPLPDSPLGLSYMLSYVLDVDASEKQRLLEMTSTIERLQSVLSYLNRAVTQLQRQVAQKQIAPKVGGNGDLGLPH